MAERFLIKDISFPDDVVPISESVQMARDHFNQLAKQKRKRKAALEAEDNKKRKELRERTLKYQAEYDEDERKKAELQRKAVLNNGFYREPEPKVLFAVRIKGIRKLAPKPKTTLQHLRLRQIHNGVFIRANKASLQMLKVVEPFITYGTLTLGRIRKLIYKRGYCRAGRMGSYNRIRIQSNAQISAKLGKYGIHGIEDLIHEIHTCGPHFKQANSFLWAFKLNTPLKGYVSKQHGFNEHRGGDWGNREELMNKFVDRMI